MISVMSFTTESVCCMEDGYGFQDEVLESVDDWFCPNCEVDLGDECDETFKA